MRLSRRPPPTLRRNHEHCWHSRRRPVLRRRPFLPVPVQDLVHEVPALGMQAHCPAVGSRRAPRSEQDVRGGAERGGAGVGRAYQSPLRSVTVQGLVTSKRPQLRAGRAEDRHGWGASGRSGGRLRPELVEGVGVPTLSPDLGCLAVGLGWESRTSLSAMSIVSPLSSGIDRGAG